jgi:thiopurine S-methyltransferase
VESEFWHNRWRDNAIPFHKDRVNHYLEKYFHLLEVGDGDDVLVPLCGKSVDMCWLRERGCTVTGVELSDIAVRDFFTEQGIAATNRAAGAFQVTEGEGITLMCGDIFALDAIDTADTSAVYDRAALIALPTEMRARYVDHLHALVGPAVPTLLLTFEYPPEDIDGPPFSVGEAEVRALYAGKREVTRLETVDRMEDEARLVERGVTGLQEHAFLLTAL